jgi:hypothetical protein
VMFLSFAKSLAEVLGGAVVVTKIITSTEQLFKWASARLSGKEEPEKPTLHERILILLFEAYVNRNKGIRPDVLCTLLGEQKEPVEKALELLKKYGVIRNARDGSWKYVRPA